MHFRAATLQKSSGHETFDTQNPSLHPLHPYRNTLLLGRRAVVGRFCYWPLAHFACGCVAYGAGAGPQVNRRLCPREQREGQQYDRVA